MASSSNKNCLHAFNFSSWAITCHCSFYSPPPLAFGNRTGTFNSCCSCLVHSLVDFSFVLQLSWHSKIFSGHVSCIRKYRLYHHTGTWDWGALFKSFRELISWPEGKLKQCIWINLSHLIVLLYSIYRIIHSALIQFYLSLSQWI